VNIHRLKDDSPTANYVRAARESTDYPVTIVSDSAGVQITRSGERQLVIFPVHEYESGRFVTGDSKYATGRGARVQVGNMQELAHAVSVCADRARRLANA